MEKPSRLQKAAGYWIGPRVVLLLPVICAVTFVGVFCVVALQSMRSVNEVRSLVTVLRRQNLQLFDRVSMLATSEEHARQQTMMPGASGCPPQTPWPYRNGSGVFLDSCCSDPLSCWGGPLDPHRARECCYGRSETMPVTYRYLTPTLGEEPCEVYDWWQLLASRTDSLWQAMKDIAKIVSQADADALAKSGYKGKKVTWSGKDEALDGADVDKARHYVGSFWGKSGWRQFQTLRKFVGLETDQQLLEVGCGAMNAGQFFLPYLDKNSYVCVEPNEVLHKQSIRDHPGLAGNSTQKAAVFIARDDFDPRPKVGEEMLFDRTWSHSVLSHAADWQLMQYFEVMAAVLKPDGVGMASLRFSDVTGREEEPSHDTSWIYPGVSYFSFPEAKCMAKRVGLELELVPEARLFFTKVCPNEFHDWVRIRRASIGPLLSAL